MNKIIVIKNKNQTCDILYPAKSLFNAESRDRINLRNMGIDFKTDQEILEWIANKDVPQGLEWRIADESNLPKDRVFRNAWHDENPTKTVNIDIEKAKEIQKNILRTLRKPILERLDIEYQKADEAQDMVVKANIAAKKQRLRDITLLPLPNNIDKLKNFFPEVLN